MRPARIAPPIALILLLGALAGLVPAARRAPARGPAVVPFQVLPSNHMVVEAKINGKGPYRLIFDLGAPVSLLSNHAAEDAGAVDKKTPRGFFMGIRGEAAIRKLELGGLTADDVPVVVMDHPY